MREIYIFLFLAIIFFISCAKKNADEFVAYPNDPQNDTVWINQPAITSPVYKIPEILSFAPTEDSFDVMTGANIRFSEILNIRFPPAGLTFANGTAVTGKVKVQVTHLHKKGDFIRFALQTASFNKWLATGGAFFIRVTKGGQELIIEPGKNITLLIREPSPVNNLKVFYGEQVLLPPIPLAINSLFTWAPGTDMNDVNVLSGQDATGPFRAYQLISKRLNWISFNYLDATQSKTKTTAVLPLNFTNKNTLVFAVLKDQKTILQLEGNGSSKSFTIDDIPLNKSIILVAISKIGENLYIGSKEATVDKNERVNITLIKKTKAEVDQFLDAL
ncbi:MAG: hypothetical protein H0X70_03815 [Segetibacter sp.]|jgi:hypothetical protein|nr:hypothetical protein [Segetibacter sp.]